MLFRSAGDVQAKFRENGGRTLTTRALDDIVAVCDRLEREPRIASLIDRCIR